jgi:hypothetical protein
MASDDGAGQMVGAVQGLDHYFLSSAIVLFTASRRRMGAAIDATIDGSYSTIS